MIHKTEQTFIHLYTVKREDFLFFIFLYDIQHCLIRRPSDFTVSEDVGIDYGIDSLFVISLLKGKKYVRSRLIICWG